MCSHVASAGEITCTPPPLSMRSYREMNNCEDPQIMVPVIPNFEIIVPHFAIHVIPVIPNFEISSALRGTGTSELRQHSSFTMPSCGACLELIVDADGNERDAATIAHACIACKTPLHSHVACDTCSVWMPEDGAYFCNAACVEKENAKQLLEFNSESGGETPAVLGPDSQGWENFLAAGYAWYALPRINNPLDSDTYEEEEEADEPVRETRAEPAPLQGDEAKPTLSSIIVAGNRIKMAFKTSHEDSTDQWYGGVV